MTLRQVVDLVIEKMGPTDARVYTCHEFHNGNIYVYSAGFEELDQDDAEMYSIFTVVNGEIVKDLYGLSK